MPQSFSTIRNGGFTLVEVLAAVVLLSIGLLAVLSAGSAARETRQRAVYLSIGRNAAQSAIEHARSNQDYTLPSSTVTGLPSGNSIVLAAELIAGSYGDAKIKHVWVTVTWPEGSGTRKVFYETYISPE
ncbi:MAG: type II secretion system protein [Armatimonadota bacterium]|nr:type II secretion system GspH family protein [bacterium]